MTLNLTQTLTHRYKTVGLILNDTVDEYRNLLMTLVKSGINFELEEGDIEEMIDALIGDPMCLSTTGIENIGLIEINIMYKEWSMLKNENWPRMNDPNMILDELKPDVTVMETIVIMTRHMFRSINYIMRLCASMITIGTVYANRGIDVGTDMKLFETRFRERGLKVIRFPYWIGDSVIS